MKKILFLMLFFLFFVQFSFLPFAVSQGWGTNLVLAFVFACALIFGLDALLPLSVAGGLILDYFSAFAFGTLLIPTFLFAIMLHGLSEKVISDRNNYFLLFPVFFLAYFLYSLAAAIISKIYALIGVQGALEAHLEANTAQFWLSMVMFALAGIFFFFVLDKLHKRLARDRIEFGMK